MSTKLKFRQVKAAKMLVEGYRTSYITEQLKIRKETLSRWQRIPEFRQLIERLTQNELDATQHHFSQLVDASFGTLWDAVRGHTSNSLRLKAALSVLKLAGIERVPVPNVPEMALKELPPVPEMPPS